LTDEKKVTYDLTDLKLVVVDAYEFKQKYIFTKLDYRFFFHNQFFTIGFFFTKLSMQLLPFERRI